MCTKIPFILSVCALFWFACQTPQKPNQVATQTNIQLELAAANRLAKLPLACIEVEYPNKLNQVLTNENQLQPPKVLHPTFYGCFDWHSAVHGYWSLVVLLKHFPNLDSAKVIREKLKQNITVSNIQEELAYFQEDAAFERTYGWAWLLQLMMELHTWNDPLARELEKNLQPLADFIAKGYLNFLPKLNYPIRVGEHTNTAFGLGFAYDYALAFEKKELKNLIEKRAKEFYLSDTNCPITWEPSGYDFLSPCLEEANLMQRVLSANEFEKWLKQFLPELSNPAYQLSYGKVSDRSDGKLVHLDGLNFSRAWCLYRIAKTLPAYKHLNSLAKAHIDASFPHIIDEHYEGTHWLGSFAIYALLSETK